MQSYQEEKHRVFERWRNLWTARLRSTAVQRLIVIAFHPRAWCLAQSIGPQVPGVSSPSSDSDRGETSYYTNVHTPVSPAPVIPHPLPRSLPVDATHVLLEGCAFRSLTLPATLGHRLVRRYNGASSTRRNTADRFSPHSSIHAQGQIPISIAEMNLEPQSQFNYASDENVFVTAASLLANGNLEILEVRIFNAERMGLLASPPHRNIF